MQSRRLNIESLESRDLLTGAPFVGPLPVGSVSATHLTTPLAPSSGNSTAPLSSAQLADELAAGQSINAFGLDLYKALQAAPGGSGNMFVSPLSISTALAMAYAGARGDTAAQMASVLHLSGDQNGVAQDFGTLLTDLNSAGQGQYALSIADALWGQQGVQFLSQFVNVMQSDYGGALNQVDFISQPEAARQAINNWVAQHTNDKIQNLFPPGTINNLTQLVLANASYFQGAWANAFHVGLPQSFALATGSTEQVPMMTRDGTYRYMQSDGFQVVEVPYAGGRLAMDVMLPTATGSSALSVSQLPSDLNGWLAGLGNQQVSVTLPKFTLTTQFDLTQQLESLGMTSAFSIGANFSGLTNPSTLKLSEVVHKAYVSVDQTGTEAAAATGVTVTATAIVVPTTPAVTFDANRPFLFVIRDTQSGSVLFMGQEADPLATAGNSSAPGINPPAGSSSPVQTPGAVALVPTGPSLPFGIKPHAPATSSPPQSPGGSGGLIMTRQIYPNLGIPVLGASGTAGDGGGPITPIGVVQVPATTALSAGSVPAPTAQAAQIAAGDSLSSKSHSPSSTILPAAVDHVLAQSVDADAEAEQADTSTVTQLSDA